MDLFATGVPRAIRRYFSLDSPDAQRRLHSLRRQSAQSYAYFVNITRAAGAVLLVAAVGLAWRRTRVAAAIVTALFGRAPRALGSRRSSRRS